MISWHIPHSRNSTVSIVYLALWFSWRHYCTVSVTERIPWNGYFFQASLKCNMVSSLCFSIHNILFFWDVKSLHSVYFSIASLQLSLLYWHLSDLVNLFLLIKYFLSTRQHWQVHLNRLLITVPTRPTWKEKLVRNYGRGRYTLYIPWSMICIDTSWGQRSLYKSD